MEKKTKQIKPISNNNMNLVLGLLLVLVAIVLIIDVGYLIRTANFLLHFLLGFVGYVLVGLILLSGVKKIFIGGKPHKFKHKATLIIGFIIALFGLSTLVTLTSEASQMTLSTLFSEYKKYFINFYANVHLPYLFRPENSGISGGLIGHLFFAVFNSLDLSKTLGLVLSIVIFIAGALIIASPYIHARIKNKKLNAPKIEKDNTTQTPKPTRPIKVSKPVEQISMVSEPEIEHKVKKEKPKKEEFYVVKDKSKEIIKNASKLNYYKKSQKAVGMEETAIPVVVKKNTAAEETSDIHTKHITFSEAGYNRVGGLQPVRFIRSGESFESPKNVSKPQETVITDQKPVEQPAIEVPNKEDIKKPEQMHLDFEEKVPEEKPISSNSNLATVQPEFSEAVVKIKEDQKIQEVQQTNVEQEEKPKTIKHKFIEPDLDLLNDYETSAATEKNTSVAEERKNTINNIFNTFNVAANCCGYVIGPSVTRYNISYTQTAQFKSVNALTSDISIRLGGVDARFEPIVPGETYSGLEIPNAVVTMVGFKDVLKSLPDRHKHPLAIAFGKNISGDVVWADLDKTPHMLISGTTGSGKSIFIHSIIMTLIMRNNPDDLRLVLVDPKRVEMGKYKGMPHLLCPNINEPEEVTVCLNKLVDEMERRYTVLEENCVSDIGQYNELCEERNDLEKMPYYVAILDEYSDLVDRAKDLQRPVISLAQKARACGIHLIICTQRPSTNVITGLIKGNLPTHVALMTASTTDSITIIGEGGAEKLLGKGDMLVQSPIVSKIGCVRLQGCFVQNKEIIKVVDFLKSTMTTDYHPDFLDLKDHSNDAPVDMPFENGSPDIHVKVDDAYEDVKYSVMNEEYYSISKIQREFGFGFTRAGRIFNQLIKDGILEKSNNKKGNSIGCKVLIHDPSYGKEAAIGSDEVATSETMEEYISNSDKTDGSY